MPAGTFPFKPLAEKNFSCFGKFPSSDLTGLLTIFVLLDFSIPLWGATQYMLSIAGLVLIFFILIFLALDFEGVL